VEIVLKGQDVVVLLAAALRESVPTWIAGDVRSLASAIGYDLAGTHRSLARLDVSHLYDATARAVRRTQAEEFLVHATQYVCPVELGGETRGVPTLWAAAPLRDRIAQPDGLPPVWPDPLGDTRGLALAPLHRVAISAARAHPRLYEALALVDAVRAGSARERALGQQLLADWLRVPA